MCRIELQLGTTTRDDGGSAAASSSASDTKAAPRFCSINPSTYRPTFSGGTYRSTASTAAASGTASSSSTASKKPELVVGSRYLTATKDTAKPVTVTATPEKKAPTKLETYMNRRNLSSTASPSTSSLNKYGSSKELQSTSGDTKRTPSKYSSSSTNNLSAIGSDGRSSQRNLSSSNLSDTDKSKTPKYSSNRDLRKDAVDTNKPSTTSRFSPKVTAKTESTSSRYGSASKLTTDPKDTPSRYGSQYPSSYAKKAAEESANKTTASSKKTECPPITYNTLYGARAAEKKERPSITINRTRSRDPSPLKNNRSRDPSPIEQVKERYGGTTSGFTSANSYTRRFRNAVSPLNQRPTSGGGSSNLLLSYMTSSEAASSKRYSRSKSKEPLTPTTVEQTLEEIKHLAEDIDRVLNVEEEEVIMVQVNVIHRATSPNPASTTPSRTRRLDISKTVPKTIERPLKKPEMVDKEIQSDRMDDPTKYSRFNPTSSRATTSPWSPEYKKNVAVNKSRTDSPAETVSSKSEASSGVPNKTTSSSLTKSNSIKNLTRSDSKKSLTRSDSVKKTALSKSSSKSENGPKSLPPTGAVKADSPAKTVLNVNKDFRKSSLNMGPTDRLRKGRSSQSSSDSSSGKSSAMVCNHHSRSERSQSVGSETSTSSSAPSSARQTPDLQRARSSLQTKGKTPKLSEKSKSKTSSSLEEELPIDNLSDICVTVTHKAPSSSNATTSTSAPNAANGVRGRALNESGAKNENSQYTTEDHVGELNVARRSSPLSSSQFDSSAATTTTTTTTQQRSSSPSTSNLGLNTVAKIFYRSVSPQLRPHPLLPTIIVPAEHRDTTELEPHTEATSLRNRCDSTSASESLKLDTEPTTNKLMGVRGCSEVSSSERSWFDKGHCDQPLELKTELLNKIRHIDSGDRSTWLASSQSGLSNGGIESQQVSERNNQGAATNGSNGNGCENTNLNTNGSAYKIRHIESGECAWWLNSNGSNNNSRNSPSGSACSADKTNHELMTTGANGSASVSASEDKGNNESRYKISHVQSGEKAWWMSPTPEANGGNSGTSPQVVSNGNEGSSKYKLRHIESGEKAWWMKSDSEPSAVTNGNGNSAKNKSANSVSQEDDAKSKYKIRPIESGERAWWMSDESSPKRGGTTTNKTEDDISEVEEDEEFDQIVIDGTLGDRASPEGVEDPLRMSQHRLSPYDNVESAMQELQKKAANLFISKHTNIDDVLGGSSSMQQAR